MTIDLKETLLQQPERFAFFQAIRLLRLFDGDCTSDCASFLRERLRVRPELSLGFPGADVVSIEEDQTGEAPSRYRMMVTFLGLYGASSPLPSFYTEDLIDEASDDHTVTRDFLDIINAPFYRLFHECWAKYRWWLKIIDENEAEYLERLLSLMGLGLDAFRETLPNAPRFLRYLGLFTQFPRSAMGLRTVISDAVGVSCVDVAPCVPCKIKIPPDQQCFMGEQATTLGENSHLGEEIDDAMGRICISIGPLDADVFRTLLPGDPLFDEVVLLTRAFLFQPMELEIEIILKRDAAHTISLGDARWAALGYTTWMFSGEAMDGDPRVVFESVD
jgi:type VI secretion system protein ImpH